MSTVKRRPEVYGVIAYSAAAARALGEPSHIVQVRAFALAGSFAEFARALIAARLEHGSPVQVARHLREWGGTSGNAREVATATVRGQVYVSPVTARPTDPTLPWPPAQSTDTTPEESTPS